MSIYKKLSIVHWYMHMFILKS